MDVSHLHSAIDIDAFADWLGLSSQSSKDALKQKCSVWRTELKDLQALSYQFASIKDALQHSPSAAARLKTLFAEFSEMEDEVRSILEPSSEMEKESSAELIFLNDIISPLNFIPFVLTFWSYIRVYILPGMSLLMPIAMLILPYILIRFVFHLNIPIDRYIGMLIGLLTGDTASLTNPSASPSIGDICTSFLNTLKESPIQAIMKFGGIGTTVVQSVIQPYLSYRHLSSINTILQTKTHALSELTALYEKLSVELGAIGMEMPGSPLPKISDERQHMAHALLDPAPYRLAIRYIGQIHALFAVASHSDLIHVQWTTDTSMTQFILKNTFDIRVSPVDRKPISINLSDKVHHALLTGPNRGGKSTALRAMTLCALLAHTYGCSVGDQAIMTPFRYMFAGLKADDIPGTKSHFEKEVEFTAQTLNMDGPTLVFVDELFHTTNPPDALASCRVYCDQLWAKKDMISVISTHLFELVENASDENVIRLCCPATYNNQTGDVTYEYGLTNGICKVSSVYEILRKYGYKPAALSSALKNSPDGQK